MSGPVLEIRCAACLAELTVEPHLRTARCPYCDSTSVVERPSGRDRPDPSFVVGFVAGRDAAVELVRRWLATRHLFAHAGLRAAALEKTSGVYVPAYLYCAIADSEYSASIGEEYTVTETYTTTDANGHTTTDTRSRTETEWCPLAGRRSGYVFDVLVTASRGLPNAELEAIEPFDLRALRRYDPALLAGWIGEEPSLALDECFQHAHDEAVVGVGERLAAFMPGDSYDDLSHRTVLRDEHIDLVLLPVWVFAVRYDASKPPVRLLVNGQSGAIHGAVPLSAPRIVLAVVLGILVLTAIVLCVLWVVG